MGDPSCPGTEERDAAVQSYPRCLVLTPASSVASLRWGPREGQAGSNGAWSWRVPTMSKALGVLFLLLLLPFFCGGRRTNFGLGMLVVLWLLAKVGR